MSNRRTCARMLACALSIVVSVSTIAADLKSPDQVKNALRILAYVKADMSSKLPTKAYARLPNENRELQEAAVAMREAVASEPAEFKARVDIALKNALTTADTMVEISKTNDDAKISAAVTAVGSALEKLNALFPESLRPVAGQLGSGPPHNGTGGPPPGLR